MAAFNNFDLLLRDIRQRINGTTVVAIAGGSCSGKTWLSHHLINCLSSNQITHVQMDDWFRDITDEQMPKVDGTQRPYYDAPGAYHIDAFCEAVTDLIQGETVFAPHYDIFSNKRLTDLQGCMLKPAPIIVVEGLYAVSALRECKRLLDLLSACEGRIKVFNVFVEASGETRLRRRIARDCSRMPQLSATAVTRVWEQLIEPAFMKWCVCQRELCSYVVLT